MKKRYYDTGDLLDAVELIGRHCEKRLHCGYCPFKIDTDEGWCSCKLRAMPKDWKVKGGETNGR